MYQHEDDWRRDYWRGSANSHVEAWRASDTYRARPFRFEDLCGKPEPESWGPAYPKTASTQVQKWRRLAQGRALSESEAAAYGEAVDTWIRGLNAVRPRQGLNPKSNCASGQAGPFNAAKHRAALLAKLFRDAESDRRRATDAEIERAYAAAMAAKRAREKIVAEYLARRAA